MEGNVTFEVDLLNSLVNYNRMHNPCQIWHLDVPVEEDPSTLRENGIDFFAGS